MTASLGALVLTVRSSALASLILLAAAASAPAGTLFSVTGAVGSNTGLGETNFNTAQSAVGEAFLFATGFTNVSITVNLVGGPLPLTAWLTNKIGAGTTNANILATSTASASGGNYTPFSGLTLGPGTYYLVLAAVQQPNNIGWNWTGSPSITQAAGVSYLGSFFNPGNTHDSWNTAAPFYLISWRPLPIRHTSAK